MSFIQGIIDTLRSTIGTNHSSVDYSSNPFFKYTVPEAAANSIYDEPENTFFKYTCRPESYECNSIYDEN